jgi:EmrB/QacA subfamily drug resistance transporter
VVHRAVNPLLRKQTPATPPEHREGAVTNALGENHGINAPSMAAQPRAYPDKLDAGLLRVAGVCVLAAVMATLDATVVSVAQRTFVGQFATTQAVVGWTMTGYMLALATVIPLTGWAADRFGTKRLFIGAVLFFTSGSLLCALAPNITLLIAFRVIQGLGGGMLMPLTFTILTRAAGPKRLGRLMAVLGIPMLLGPIGGPILGGWLIDSYGWQWIFRINLPIGLAAIMLAAFIFPKDQPSPTESFDFLGMLMLSPGLATLLYGVSSIPGRGTVADAHVYIPAAIGILLIAGFVLHALSGTDHPLIDVRLFTNRVLTMATATMFLFAMAFFGAALLIPSYFQQLLGQTPLQSGLHMIPQGLGAMITMPIAGRFMDKHGPGKSVLVGVSLIATGMGTFAYGVNHHYAYLPTLLIGLATIGLGMGATMMPVAGSALQTLRPQQVARGSTLINVDQQVAGSIGAALMSMILTSQFNRSQYITAANKAAALRQEAARHGVPPDPTKLPPQVLAPNFLQHMTNDLSHAYTVVFVVAVCLVAATLIPAIFLPKEPAIESGAPMTPTPAR